jgi:hypothetical protein
MYVHLISFILAHIIGKLHPKTVANAFWEYELYEELSQSNLSDKWSFTKECNENELSGMKDNAMEYMVRKQTSTTYGHECHRGCALKGRLTNTLIKYSMHCNLHYG